jgi:hypothetical protein
METNSVASPSRRALMIGLTAVTVMAVESPGQAAGSEDMVGMAAAMRACIDECQKCHIVCLTTATELGLEPARRRSTPAQIRAMLDSAQICATTADFMARGSPNHTAICRLCADICEDCIRACTNMPGMESCIVVCEACVKSCRKMAAMH